MTKLYSFWQEVNLGHKRLSKSKFWETGVDKAVFEIGKSTFLTIQLWPQFGFGHRTPKPDIFGHPTIKTVQI